MSVNYVSDNNEAPQWQMDIMEERLKEIKKDPDSIRDIEELFKELNSEIGLESK